MEKGLDEIAEGKDVWEKIVGDFYGPFAKNLKEKYDEIPKEDLTIKTDKKCPKCGGNLVIRRSIYNSFIGCEKYPDCRYIDVSKHRTKKVEKKIS